MKKLLFLPILFTTVISFAQEATYVSDELLVQLAPGADSEALSRNMQQDVGLLEMRCVSAIMNIYVLHFTAGQNLDDLQRNLPVLYKDISVIQKNHYVFERETIPSDTLFTNVWHLKNTGQTGGTLDADIDAADAWDITTGGLTTHGDTIVVCIVEGSGVDINHADLKDNIWKNYAEIEGDGIDNDNNGYIDDHDGWNIINDDDGISAGSHGTRVAGMIGATGNNITGITGVNWDVKMMVVQGQQASNEASVIEAYTYPLKMRKMYNESFGTQGAFVVATNSSWGIDNGDPADSPLWCAMYDTLGAYGILNIAATTNNNVNVDVSGDLPTTCASEFLVAVTMTNSQDLRAGSGYGTTHVDLGAPGSSVQTTAVGNFYTNASGTSFATPCVAGCVALAYAAPCAEFINLVKYDPAQAALDMRSYMLSSVDVSAPLTAEVASGGRVNVKNMIDSMLAACDPNTCVPPYNLVASDVTDSAADIAWQGFSTDYVVYLQEGGAAPVELDMTGASSFSIDTLIPCTWYTILVEANCGTDSSNYSFPLTFETDGCCDNPVLVEDSKTNNSITIAWSPVLYATSYDLRYKQASDATWTEFTGATSPYTFTGLLPCTDYDFQVHTMCTDSTQGYGPTHTFKTLGCGACTEQVYCPVAGANSSTEWIESITLNGYSATSGDNSGWLQSYSIITALTPGSVYDITLVPGYPGFNFTETFSVWIDFDQDGTFSVAEALVVDETTNSTLTVPLAIPAGTPIGITKIRIGMNYDESPPACPTAAFFGEYEDYCVYIGSQTGMSENELNLQVFPNPAHDALYIKGNHEISGFRLFDSTGKLIMTVVEFDGGPIKIDHLENGIYFIEVSAGNAIYPVKFVKS